MQWRMSTQQLRGMKNIPFDLVAGQDCTRHWTGPQGRFLWVKNIPFDIMEETVMQILVKVVQEVKSRRPGVQRIRLGELWASPSCNTFCKLGPINKEH